jgi:4-aminobutyrate aminotransferase
MNSGRESIDSAAKLAFKATGRRKLIAFNGAFHGRTLFATALSRSKTLHWSAYEGVVAALRADIHHAPAPRCAACNRDAHCCVEGVRNLLERYPDQVAAVFMEAQQGEGGYYPWLPEPAQRLRALTREHGVLLVTDEIQSGWGRTGRWFGFEHLGIEPDIVVFGKAVGGGLPLAGVGARQELMARWQPGEHGTTFGGNPVACAAGLAALNVIECEGLVERAAEQGARIRQRLGALIGQHGIVDVRGFGLMIGIELRDAAGRPDYARCEAVKLRAREMGLLVLTCGANIGDPATDSSVIRLIPPLNTPDELLQEGLDLLIAALTEPSTRVA